MALLSAPEEQDHFGLTLVAARLVTEIKIVGSLDLEHVVAWRDTGLGAEAWEILTVREDGSGGWVRPSCPLLPLLIFSSFFFTDPLTFFFLFFQEARRLNSLPTVRLLGPALIEVTMMLEPVKDLYGEEMSVRKIKLVSRGKKNVRLSVCGFELDGWKI